MSSEEKPLTLLTSKHESTILTLIAREFENVTRCRISFVNDRRTVQCSAVVYYWIIEMDGIFTGQYM